MAGKRDKPEDTVLKLRQVDLLQGQGKSVQEATSIFKNDPGLQWQRVHLSRSRSLDLYQRRHPGLLTP